jgi:predicted Zn-dependent protease
MNSLAEMLRWLAPADPAPLLTHAESRAIAERALGMRRGPGDLRIGVQSSWRGDIRWGRNRLVQARDSREQLIRIQRVLGYMTVEVSTSRSDDAGLRRAVEEAEQLLRDNWASRDPDPLPPRLTAFPRTRIWNESTLGTGAEARALLGGTLIGPIASAKLSGAGYLSLGADSHAWIGTDGEDLYSTSTVSQCSMTVRDQTGRGSGWAGASSHDWSSIDPVALNDRARLKCETSRDPSALEPGRYTVVLEPQAVADLMNLMVVWFPREPAEQGVGPFAKRPGFSKLGDKLADARISISFDPADPLLGVTPFDDAGEPVRAVKWFDAGVLMALAYGRRYAVNNFNQNLALPNANAYAMTGGETTVEEMIKGTRRGLLVSRFSGCQTLHPESLLSTGHTRDGLWLIENGKVTRPVKNFRFTDSPLLMLNSIEALGKPVPVFRPEGPMVVPPLKASNFNFTRLVDAV